STRFQTWPTPPARPRSGPGHARKAVFVGITYALTKQGVLPERILTMAKNHRRRLCNWGFFEEQDTRLLIDDETPPPMTCGLHTPTKANLIRDLNWLLTGAQAGDVLYFYYVGHGGSD